MSLRFSSDADYKDYLKKRGLSQAGTREFQTTVPVTAPLKLKKTKQTKTEIEYGRLLSFEYPNADIIPWGVTLRMKNGHKYTPDYLVKGSDFMLLVEVKQRGKNGFRQNSYQRAKLAFDQCLVEYPLFRWRWAEKQGGIWKTS